MNISMAKSNNGQVLSVGTPASRETQEQDMPDHIYQKLSVTQHLMEMDKVF